MPRRKPFRRLGKLIVTVTKEKRVYIGRMEIPFAEVEDKLRANAKLQSDREVYLHADKALSYGDVVKVMAAIKLAGGDKMGLITDRSNSMQASAYTRIRPLGRGTFLGASRPRY